MVSNSVSNGYFEHMNDYHIQVQCYFKTMSLVIKDEGVKWDRVPISVQDKRKPLWDISTK